MTEREKMNLGMLFTDMGEGMVEERLYAKDLAFEFNNTLPSNIDKRIEILKKLLGEFHISSHLEGPINVAYGKNIKIGKNTYGNFNLTLIDEREIKIGDGVLIAPNVTITTTGHPIDPTLRSEWKLYSLPINIEDNVWIGAHSVIFPGVTIGKNSIIGAGSVVTKDIPENVIAFGNPCKIYREITEEDKKRDLAR